MRCAPPQDRRPAALICILNILRAGDHILCASTIYGGTINLFAVTLKRFGIEVSFVDADADEQTLCSQIQPNTKAVFAETIANPAIAVLDIEKIGKGRSFARYPADC